MYQVAQLAGKGCQQNVMGPVGHNIIIADTPDSDFSRIVHDLEVVGLPADGVAETLTAVAPYPSPAINKIARIALPLG